MTAGGDSLAQQPGSGRRLGKWGALGIIMALAFLNYLDRNLLFPMQALIAKDLNLGTEALGALSTGFFLVYAVTAPVAGALSDRMSRKTILLTSLVAWSLVTALSGTATGFISLLIWRTLTGVGEGGYFPTATSIIGDLFASRERGRALALHGVCTTLGGAVGYAAGGILGERLGWRAPFFLAMLPGLVLAVVLALYFEDPQRGQSDPVPVGDRQPRRSYLRIVTSARVLLIALAAMAAAFAMNGLNSFLPLYLKEARGISVRNAGLLTAVFFSLTLVGQITGGWTADSLAQRLLGARPLFVAVPYLWAAPAVLAIVESKSVGLALACYGLTQLARGYAEPNLYGTILESVAPWERGTAQGFLLAATFAGSTISPLLAGWIIRNHGYPSALMMLGAGALVSGLLALTLFVYVRQVGPLGQRTTA